MDEKYKDPKNLIMRKATLEDIPILLYWDSQPHVIESGVEDWEWEKELAQDPPWREIWIAQDGERPIGVLQSIDPALEEFHYWGDIGPGYRALDIWIGEKGYLGLGWGTAMMSWQIDRCFEGPEVHHILIDPLRKNFRARKFYAKLGFQEVGQRFFDEDDCMVMELSREDWFSLKSRNFDESIQSEDHP